MTLSEKLAEMLTKKNDKLKNNLSLTILVIFNY